MDKLDNLELLKNLIESDKDIKWLLSQIKDLLSSVDKADFALLEDDLSISRSRLASELATGTLLNRDFTPEVNLNILKQRLYSILILNKLNLWFKKKVFKKEFNSNDYVMYISNKADNFSPILFQIRINNSFTIHCDAIRYEVSKIPIKRTQTDCPITLTVSVRDTSELFNSEIHLEIRIFETQADYNANRSYFRDSKTIESNLIGDADIEDWLITQVLIANIL